MRSSQPGFSQIFRTPLDFISVLATLYPSKSLCAHAFAIYTCIFHTYDPLRSSTLFTLHLSPNSWDCDVIVSYAYTFRLLVQAQHCVRLKIWENPGWEERFLLTSIIRSPITWHLWQCPRCSLCLNWQFFNFRSNPYAFFWFLSEMSLFTFSGQALFQIVCVSFCFFWVLFLLTKTRLILLMLDWSSPSHPPLGGMVLFIDFLCWLQHGLVHSMVHTT